jgi:hypothetical protein
MFLRVLDDNWLSLLAALVAQVDSWFDENESWQAALSNLGWLAEVWLRIAIADLVPMLVPAISWHRSYQGIVWQLASGSHGLHSCVCLSWCSCSLLRLLYRVACT